MASQDNRHVASFTLGRRMPKVLGRLPGMTLPVQLSPSQLVFGGGVAACAWFAMRVGASTIWTVLAALVVGFLGGKAIRKVRIDDRNLLSGLLGRYRQMQARRRHPQTKRRAADAVAGNVVIGPDHSTWLVFAVEPQAFGSMSTAESRVGAVAAVEQLIVSVAARRWRLSSMMTATDPATVVEAMRRTTAAPTWEREIASESRRLDVVPMTGRTFWLWVDVGDAKAPLSVDGVVARLRRLAGFAPPARESWIDLDSAAAASAAVLSSAPHEMGLREATEAEIAGLIESAAGSMGPAPQAEPDWPHLSRLDADPGAREVRGGNEGASAWSLGEAVWSEPKPGIAVAVRDGEAVAHMSAAVSGLPTSWKTPGEGEVLWRLDALPDQWDWLVHVSVTDPATAKARTHSQAQQLQDQVKQYGGDPAGAPPEVGVAMGLIDQERDELAQNPGRCEYVVSVVLSTQLRLRDVTIAEDEVRELRDRFGRLRSITSPMGIRVANPAGDQVVSRRLWTPSRFAGTPVLVDYRQFLLSDGLAGLGPLLQSRVGDPQGGFCGFLDDRGTFEPVLFDPTLAPRGETVGAQDRSPAVGVIGTLGTGKSVFAKQGSKMTLFAGGQVTITDRSEAGEYVTFAKAMAVACPELSVTILDVRDPSSGSLDPMRSVLSAEAAEDAAVRLISVATRLDPQGTVAAALGQAARLTRSGGHGVSLLELVRAGQEIAPEEPDWGRVERIIGNLALDPVGGVLFDPEREPAHLDADLVVLWAPGLKLSDAPDTLRDIASTTVVLATAFIARGLVFAEPERFALLLCDELWSMIDDPRFRSIIREAIRDGRKHNAAVWLITQSASDFRKYPDLGQLLGRVALFGVDSDAAALDCCELAGIDPQVGVKVLQGVRRGTMVWQDVFGRLGLVDVCMPADEDVAEAFNTKPPTPKASATAGS